MTTPAIILVRPQMGENIGAVARAMMNFGLRELRIVAPRDGWPNPAAEAMAAHGLEIIQNAKIYDATRDALEDLHYVYASTARDRRVRKPQLTPRESVADMHARAGEGQKLGLLFGPERTGLENEDIALSQAIVTVPTDPDHWSLNLAQCAVVMAYEWYSQSPESGVRSSESGQWAVVSGQDEGKRDQQAEPALSERSAAHLSASRREGGKPILQQAEPALSERSAAHLSASRREGGKQIARQAEPALNGNDQERETRPAGRVSPERAKRRSSERQQARREQNKDTVPASQKDLNAFFDHLEASLDKTYFFKLDAKKPRMWRNLRATLQRAELSAQEVHTLYGMVVALEKGEKKRG